MSKQCKPGFRHNVSDIFRVQVAATHSTGIDSDARSPVLTLGSTSFIYIRLKGLWICAVTRSNQDCSVILEYLFLIESLLKVKLSVEDLTEDIITNNFTLIYSLISDTMEFGYPVNTDLASIEGDLPGSRSPLKRIDSVFLSSKNKALSSLDSRLSRPGSVSSQDVDSTATSAVPWRSTGIKYRRNEIFLNVTEKIHVLINPDGNILRAYVEGQIHLKSRLLGMPQCQFGFADNPIVRSATKKFHQCVDLARLDSDGSILFIPPDGDFQLMLYRCALLLQLPFTVQALIVELNSGRLQIKVRVRARLPAKIVATNVTLSIPLMSQVSASCNASSGKAKLHEQEIIWRMPKIVGDQEMSLTADVTFAPNQPQKTRAPIHLNFDLDMYACLGVQVSYLSVNEPSRYKTVKWIKYISQAGLYEIRY